MELIKYGKELDNLTLKQLSPRVYIISTNKHCIRFTIGTGGQTIQRTSGTYNTQFKNYAIDLLMAWSFYKPTPIMYKNMELAKKRV